MPFSFVPVQTNYEDKYPRQGSIAVAIPARKDIGSLRTAKIIIDAQTIVALCPNNGCGIFYVVVAVCVVMVPSWLVVTMTWHGGCAVTGLALAWPTPTLKSEPHHDAKKVFPHRKHHAKYNCNMHLRASEWRRG